MSDEVPPQDPQSVPYGSGVGAPRGASGIAIASLVLGIISIVLFCVWHVSMPCAVLAIVLGALGRSKANSGEAGGRGVATAGMVLGLVAIGLVVLAFAGCLAFLGFMGKHAPEIQKSLQEMQQQMQQQMEQQRHQTMPASGPSAVVHPFLDYVRARLA